MIDKLGMWSLEVPEDGYGYICNGDESLWVEDLLTVGVYQKQGSLLLMSPPPPPTPAWLAWTQRARRAISTPPSCCERLPFQM